MDATISSEYETAGQVNAAAVSNGWFAFAPKADIFADGPMELPLLNEKFAGENGFIPAKDGHFVRSANGQPVRF